MTALPPQTTIAEERAGLERRRVSLMTRRGEVAKLLRNEHVDGQERRELQEEQADLTTKIRSVENELSTLDDAEQSLEEDRKAAAIVDTVRRREASAEKARIALAEVVRQGSFLHSAIANAVQAENALRAAEAVAWQAGQDAIQSADDKGMYRDALTPLLTQAEIADLLAEVSKGRLRNDLVFHSRVTRRVNEALAMLGRFT